MYRVRVTLSLYPGMVCVNASVLVTLLILGLTPRMHLVCLLNCGILFQESHV